LLWFFWLPLLTEATEKRACVDAVHTVGHITGEDLEFREPYYFIAGYKKACANFSPGETLSLFYMKVN
jgi:hypothetical protein